MHKKSQERKVNQDSTIECRATTARGFELIDMHPIFSAHYERYREVFEFPREQHWNRLGHQLVAEAITRSKLFAGLHGVE